MADGRNIQAPDFSVVIPVFNKWEMTRNCLASLKEHTSEYDCQVVVVDNASSDATATELFPLGQVLFGGRFALIRSERNLNFGPASNVGARAASSPLVLFLNNDTLLTPGWAPPLVAALNGEKAPGAVGPLLLYEDDTVQHMGVTLAPSGFRHLYRYFPRAHPVVGRARQLQAITAAALMMPRELFLRCDGFFEEYRNGFEDLELCLRIRQENKTLACVTESVVYHLESQSPGRKQHDDHNAKVLRERCERYFYVDYHHHGARDGFTVFVDDLLDISLALGRDDEAALSRTAEGLAPSGWLRLVTDHPFWAHGKELLAKALESQGKLAEALELREDAAYVLQDEESHKQLLRAAARAGHAGLVSFAQKMLRTIAGYREDEERARRYARYVLDHTAGRGDPLLERLYAEKLARMFPD